MNKLISKKIPLHGKRINLIRVSKNDLLILKKWRNTNEIWMYNTQYVLLNMLNQKNWYEQITQKNSDNIMFVVTTKSGKPIGVCGLTHVDKENKHAYVAIIIGEIKYQNKGFGKEILQILMNYGFHKIKLHKIVAEVFGYNQTSVKFFEKLNFRHEAILHDSLWRRGRWWNIFVMSILQHEYQNS